MLFSTSFHPPTGQDRTLSVMKKSIEISLTFGVYTNGNQIGFARVVTDYATFAYIADVFILESYRGNGYSKELVKVIISHTDLKTVRRWMLATKDAHELYSKFGFRKLETLKDLWKSSSRPHNSLSGAAAPFPSCRAFALGAEHRNVNRTPIYNPPPHHSSMHHTFPLRCRAPVLPFALGAEHRNVNRTPIYNPPPHHSPMHHTFPLRCRAPQR